MELFLSSGDVLPLFDLHFNREVLLLKKKNRYRIITSFFSSTANTYLPCSIVGTKTKIHEKGDFRKRHKMMKRLPSLKLT